MADQQPLIVESSKPESSHRLDQPLTPAPTVHTVEEQVAQRVVALLAERMTQQRTATNGAPGFSGLISTAIMAARRVQTIDPSAPPGVAPPSAESGFRSWLVTQVASEWRLMFWMYFDPRYRLSRIAQFGVPLGIVLMVLNYFFLSAIPLVGFLLERLVLIVLTVILYKILVREAARYQRVLEYLNQYGHA